jgi:hypothetical protein
MLMWAGQIHHRFEGGVNELCRPDKRYRQKEHCPIPQGQAQPQCNQQHQHGDKGMDPGIPLRADNVPQAMEGMPKGVRT